MPNAEFFSQFGFYTVRGFLDRDFCDEICSQMKKSTSKPGKFLQFEAGDEILDSSFKKRLEMEDISAGIISEINNKLLSALSEVEKTFSVELKNVQKPKFALYRPKDFYKAHIDTLPTGNIPKDIDREMVSVRKERKVSAIIFLNDESEEPLEGAYGGGNLTFFGLMPDSAFGKFGLPLIGECGMLVTFPPSVVHEVTPVAHGNRYSIATWYI